MVKRAIAPIHPGEILLEDFMKPLGISQSALAKAIAMPAPRINEIVHGNRSITADTALRLGRYFDTDPQSWMNLQSHYDIEIGKQFDDEATKNDERPSHHR